MSGLFQKAKGLLSAKASGTPGLGGALGASALGPKRPAQAGAKIAPRDRMRSAFGRKPKNGPSGPEIMPRPI